MMDTSRMKYSRHVHRARIFRLSWTLLVIIIMTCLRWQSIINSDITIQDVSLEATQVQSTSSARRLLAVISHRQIIMNNGTSVPGSTSCRGAQLYEELHDAFKNLFILSDVIGKKDINCPTLQKASAEFWFAVVLLSLAILIVLLVIAIIADSFFCPSVSEMVRQLDIPPIVAGVTLLPLGNGAPDVFSSIMSAAKGSGGIGAGAIGGAGLFVVTIVLGTVFLVAKPFKVPQKAFMRDCLFYFACLSYVVFLLYSSYVKQSEMRVYFMAIMPIIYVIYIITMVTSELFRKDINRKSVFTGLEQPFLSEEEDDETIDSSSPIEEFMSARDVFERGSNHVASDILPAGSPHYSVVDYYFRAVEMKANLSHHLTDGVRETPYTSARATDISDLSKIITMEAPAIMIQHANQEDEAEKILIRSKSRRRSLSYDAGSLPLLLEMDNASRDSGIDSVEFQSLHSRQEQIMSNPTDSESEREAGTTISATELGSNEDLKDGLERPNDDDTLESAVHENHRMDKLISALEVIWITVEFPIYWLVAFFVPEPDPKKFRLWLLAVNISLFPILIVAFWTNVAGLEKTPSFMYYIPLISAPVAASIYCIHRMLRTQVKCNESPSQQYYEIRNDYSENEDTVASDEVTNYSKRTQLLMTCMSFLSCIMLLSLTADKLVDYLVAFGSILKIGNSPH